MLPVRMSLWWCERWLSWSCNGSSGWSASAPRRTTRTWRSRCCATSYWCYAGGWPGPLHTGRPHGARGPWRRYCLGTAGRSSSSRPQPCCAASGAGAAPVDLTPYRPASTTRYASGRGRGRGSAGQGETRWGYLRIVGECRKRGIRVSATSLRTILRQHGLWPAPRRGGPSWTQFLRTQAAGVLACDFLTVQTSGLPASTSCSSSNSSTAGCTWPPGPPMHPSGWP